MPVERVWRRAMPLPVTALLTRLRASARRVTSKRSRHGRNAGAPGFCAGGSLGLLSADRSGVRPGAEILCSAVESPRLGQGEKLRRLHLLRVDPASGTRIAGVEGLRALAASSILVFHCWLYSSPSETRANLGPVSRYLLPQLPLGVTLFFVLSGFLLYRPFVAALLRGGARPSLLRYLRNRALRILPAYWFILIVVAVVLQTALVYDGTGVWGPGRLDDPGILARNAIFVQNYGTPWTGSFFTGIGPAWSLAIEAVFYLTLPLIVLAAFALTKHARTRTDRRMVALAPAALMLLVGVGGKLMTYLLNSADLSTVLYWSFLANADKFAFGMAVAVLYVDVEDRFVHVPRWGRAVAAAGLLAVALPTAMFTTNNAVPGADGTNLIYNTMMALACAGFVALVVLPRSESRHRLTLAWVLESRPLVAAGLVSYSLFLWHEPVVYWLRRHDLTLAGPSGFFFNLALLSTSVGILSVLTYRLVELPALRRKSRQSTRPDESVPAYQVEAAP
jgi:peptidoglycan/LPS O-acetylase OafA/YrhL